MKKLNIKTGRLLLRQFKINDITPEYVKALNNQKIIGLTESRYRGWTLKQVRDYVREKGNKKGESLLIGIFLKNGKHIGNIRLHSLSDHNKRVELGIMIWDKKEWGKDYGTEALGAIVKFIFEELELHKVCAEYYSINKGSAKMFKKLDFQIEGILKDHFLVEGKFVDAIRIAKFND